MQRWQLAFLGVAALTLLTALPGVNRAQDNGSNATAGADVVSDLKTTLEKGLRCRRPVEFAFVNKVVQLVDQGTLPKKLVLTTFDWARKKPDHYQATYFMFAMRERAKKLGVNNL
jgi:hypothetical protein